MCRPGLHITLGIFYRLFCLLEDECHKLDLRIAEEDSIDEGGTSYGHYVRASEKLKKIKYDLQK